MQLEGIALHGEIQVADGKSANNVADSSSGQVDVHAGGARDVLYQGDAALLVRRQPDFHCVYVVGHAFLRMPLRALMPVSRKGVFHRLGPL